MPASRLNLQKHLQASKSSEKSEITGSSLRKHRRRRMSGVEGQGLRVRQRALGMKERTKLPTMRNDF